MSKLTKSQRDALPASAFADSARRLFPLVDCSDVSDAASLIGKAKNPAAVKAKIMAFAEKKSCPIPDAWKETSKMSVTFALEDSNRREDGDWAIYPNATLFVAGEYADKGFEMTPEEMWLACDQFSEPVGGNIEHSDFLKGRACEVRSIRLDENDSFTLRGEVAVPLWLDSQLGEHERKLSCEWDRETKTLSGIGLVVHPRVPEAALMSAYAEFASSRHDTPQGQMVMQRIHQVAAEGGAVCSKGNANMASSHEASTIQKIHDMATEHGAACSSTKSGNPYPMFAGAVPDAAASTAEPSTPQKEGKHMTPVEQFMAWLQGGAKPEDEAASTTAAPATVATHSVTADPRDTELARMRQERDAAKSETLRVRAEAIHREAVAFADRIVVTEQRAWPAAREAIITGHQQAALDDMNYGVVTFGEGQTTTRVERFEAVLLAAPPHRLTSESKVDALMSVLQGHRETPAVDPNAKADRAELDRLLNMTPLGQANGKA